jgi:hypothetical protein
MMVIKRCGGDGDEAKLQVMPAVKHGGWNWLSRRRRGVPHVPRGCDCIRCMRRVLNFVWVSFRV